MAPKKAVDDKKPKKPEMTPEMKALKEKEKALVKVPAPDRAGLDALMEKINADINAVQEKIKKVADNIGAKSVGKEEHYRAKDELRAKLDEYSTKIDGLQKQKQAIRGTMQDKQKEGRDKRTELNSMKKKIGFESEAEIDQKIRDIEYEMHTQSFTLKQEKEMMVKMSDLKKQKPELRKYQQLEGTANTGNDGFGEMKGSIEEVNKELTETFDAKKVIQAALAKLVEARNKVMGDVPELFKEREALNLKIRGFIMQRNEARGEFNKLNNEYQAYMSEVRVLRAERGRLERGVRQAEWEERQKGEVEDTGPAALPFADDLQLLENLDKYLKALLKEKKEDKKEEPQNNLASGSAGAGHVMLVAKGDRDEEFFFAATKKKSLKKKGSGSGKAKAIVHQLETLTIFDKYKVPSPNDASLVQGSIDAVAKKVTEFKEKQEAAVKKEKEKKETPAKVEDVVVEVGDANNGEAEKA